MSWEKNFYAKMNVFSIYFEADHSWKDLAQSLYRSPVEVGFRYVDGDYFYCAEDRNIIKEDLAKDLIENISYTNQVLEETSLEFLNYCQKLNTNLKDKSNQELLELYFGFCDVYAKTNAGWLHPLMIEEILAPLIQDKVKEIIDPVKDFDLFNEVITFLLLPQKETEMAKEKKELLNLAISKASDEQLTEHAKKYSYMGMLLLSGRPWTGLDLKKRLEEIKNPEKELEELNKIVVNDYSDLLKEINDPRFWKLVELGREISFLRTFHLEKTNEGCFYARNLFTEIGRRAELSYEETIHLLPQEIEDFLKTGNSVDKEKIKERQKGYVVINQPEVEIFVGDDIKKFKEEHEFKIEDATEISGTIANKGVVRGIAKVLLDPSEASKVNPGDILIAELTTPNFIPAMEKAAAFVTNIGGITSHAAIIAREMGKVCLVGTKHATKIFKDNDLVEVDADKGIVRKVE